jgi:hypothetical protein
MHGTCLDDDPEPETAAEGNRLNLPRVSLASSGVGDLADWENM